LQKLNLEQAKAKDGEDPNLLILNLNKSITELKEENTKYRIAQNMLLMEKDELMNAQKDQILALLAEKEASVLECLEIKKQSQVLHSQVEQLKLQLKVVSQSHQTYEHDQNLLKSLRKENLRL
jgi:hypothetical protein